MRYENYEQDIEQKDAEKRKSQELKKARKQAKFNGKYE